MEKVFLLGANKEIDRSKQVVETGQIIQMEGYMQQKYGMPQPDYQTCREQHPADRKKIGSIINNQGGAIHPQ